MRKKYKMANISLCLHNKQKIFQSFGRLPEYDLLTKKKQKVEIGNLGTFHSFFIQGSNHGSILVGIEKEKHTI
jgi:hypothetical protein